MIHGKDEDIPSVVITICAYNQTRATEGSMFRFQIFTSSLSSYKCLSLQAKQEQLNVA